MTAQQPVATDSGTLPHALGFLAFIPVPFLNLVIAGVVQGLSYRAVRRRGPRAAALGRTGANWGFTVAIASGVLLLLQAALYFPLRHSGLGFFPIGVPIVFLIFLALMHLVLTIGGTVAARKGIVYKNEIALQFYK